MRSRYDLIVIGGGHAGTEAAAAAAAVADGARVALLTMDPARIGQMSCNPAIGGLGKGHIVREIDALGGLMGLAIDATGIMFKVLNTSRGAAVRGPRAQADKYAYAAEVQRLIAARSAIDVIAGRLEDILIEHGRVCGVMLSPGSGLVTADTEAIEHHVAARERARSIYPSRPQAAAWNSDAVTVACNALVLTTGTFMRGLMHTGEQRTAGGRVGEDAAAGISQTLRRLGFELGRLKTGTPPRLDVRTLDWNGLAAQVGDEDPAPFSALSPHALPARRFPHLRQVSCRVSHTTAEAHEIIRANLDRAPMYSGQIEAECGPRYCPSIEDKVVRFADRPSHHVFLEPESLHTYEIYCNGISTSLPIDVQERIVHLMPGCARAEILRWGYAVEYDMVWPYQIDSTCMTKRIDGLFLAGQINCTTGYEEAGGQGVIAGLNAARYVSRREPVRLGREQAYIGVMLDDLVTKQPREPYRMFTSRAEHRLLLRPDNADTRLTPWARENGLISAERWAAYKRRQGEYEALMERMDRIMVDGRSLRELARRPDIEAADLLSHLDGEVDRTMLERVMTDAKYEGYIARQRAEIRRQAESDRQRIPEWLDPCSVPGLRSEAAEVLAKFRPATLGQASRLAGVNPADITILAVAIRRGWDRPDKGTEEQRDRVEGSGGTSESADVDSANDGAATKQPRRCAAPLRPAGE